MLRLLIIAISLMLSLQSVHAATRGLLAAQLSDKSFLSTAISIDTMLTTAAQCGTDTLFVQVYRANKAWFASSLADDTPYRACVRTEDGDALEILINRAHARGMRVYAWINLLSLGNNPRANILQKYGPKILTRNRSEKNNLFDYKVDNQYFLEPSNLIVRAELAGLVRELLSRYKGLDGILFDYIRYPDVHPDYGYASENVAAFRKAFPDGRPGRENSDWEEWKRKQVTGLLSALAKEAREVHPGIKVTATACVPYLRAQSEAYQDWPRWLSSGIVDNVMLMTYPDNLKDFNKDIDEALANSPDKARLIFALPAYKLKQSPLILLRQLAASRAAVGESYAVFHYDSLHENPVLCKVFSGEKSGRQERE